jgi:hypothetical protein
MQLSAYGMSCSLGTGWSGRIFKDDDGSDDIFPPAIQATTGTLPATPDSVFGGATVPTLTTSQVFLTCFEYYPDHVVVPGQEDFAPSYIPHALTLADFSEEYVRAEDAVSPSLVAAQRHFTANDRPCCVYVVLGSPTQSLVDQANAVLSTMQLAATNDRYREVVRETDGLVSYWRLGELSGTTAADEQNANPGTWIGSRTPGRPALIVRSPNPSTGFSGSAGPGLVRVADSPSHAVTDQLTVEAWIRAPAGIAQERVLARKVNTFTLFVNSEKRLGIRLWSVPTWPTPLEVRGPANAIVPGQAQHVVATVGGPTVAAGETKMVHLYIDGNRVASGCVKTPLGEASD